VNEIVELKPGGSNVFVTFESMQEYLDLFRQKVCELVVGSVRRQFSAFLAGFKSVIDPKLIARFTSE
jgi:hypothetical protein